MENIAVSRQHRNKGNKENAQPANGSKSFIKSGKSTAVPFKPKSNEKQEIIAKSAPLKTKAKQTETRSTTGEAPKRVITMHRDGKGAAATDVKPRATHNQAVLAERAVKDEQMVTEAPKPPATVRSSKSAPGMYKGKIVQSKIGSIWRTSATVGGTGSKPAAPKTDNKRFEGVTKIRSKSVADIHGNGSQKPTQMRPRPLLNRPAHVKPVVSNRRPSGFCSARPPSRTVPATLTSTSSRCTQRNVTMSSKEKIPVTDQKANKPPVTSTLSQYRATTETAEEKRAKLEQWLAAKGKTLKRPAMTTAAPAKPKVSAKPESDFKLHSQPPAQCKPKPEPSVEAHKTDVTANTAGSADTWGADLKAHGETPAIMNTTLDLLDNSDADLLVDPEEMDDIVVNLCDALEAMETPSTCNNGVCSDGEVEDKCEKDELKIEMPEDAGEQQVKDGVEENDDQEVKTDEEVESDESGMETLSQMDGASVVKYSVKTTPYLQSVRKTIEDDLSASASRRKSNIKDLKFLTPVRRSCRIQRKSSHLPTMLLDHDPCVSSLAELVKLDDNPNAYICRKNSALLEDLPDQPPI